MRFPSPGGSFGILFVQIEDVKGYLLQPKNTCSRPYEIWSPDILTIFAVIRVFQDKEDATTPEICEYLVRRGCKFRTLRRISAPKQRTRPPPSVELEFRPGDFKGDKVDYAAYEQTRHAALDINTWGRAALMQGGLMWRLTVDSTGQEGIQKVIDGPSAEAVSFEAMDFNNKKLGIYYEDDVIHPIEISIIHGEYKMYRYESKSLQYGTLNCMINITDY